MTDRDNLDETFNWRVERTLSQALTLQYDKVMFILEPTEAAQAAIGKRVTVYDYPDGRLVIRHDGTDLPYRPPLPHLRQDQEGQPGRHHREQAAGVAARPDPAEPGHARARQAQYQSAEATGSEGAHVWCRLISASLRHWSEESAVLLINCVGEREDLSGQRCAYHVLPGECASGEIFPGDRSNRCINHHQSGASIWLLPVNKSDGNAVVRTRAVAPAAEDKVKISSRLS